MTDLVEMKYVKHGSPLYFAMRNQVDKISDEVKIGVYLPPYIDGIFKAIQDAGYAIVPVEPTPEMKTNGGDAICSHRGFNYEAADKVWSAMIQASQQPNPEEKM